MTQADLASASGVSLPTIQNIEGGRANPSLLTLEGLLRPLNLQLKIEPIAFDWDLLAACGAPIMQLKPTRERPGATLLIKSLRGACFELSQKKGIKEDDGRKRECVAALLLALKFHYPSFFSCSFNSKLFEDVIPKDLSGRLIKLKRQAVAALAKYL